MLKLYCTSYDFRAGAVNVHARTVATVKLELQTYNLHATLALKACDFRAGVLGLVDFWKRSVSSLVATFEVELPI